MINRIVTFIFCFLSLLCIAQEKFAVTSDRVKSRTLFWRSHCCNTFGSGATRAVVPSVRPLIG